MGRPQERALAVRDHARGDCIGPQAARERSTQRHAQTRPQEQAPLLKASIEDDTHARATLASV